MYLSQISYAQPVNRYNADTIGKWTGANPGFVRDKIGIACRAFLSATETGLDLAAAATETFFSENPSVAPDSIDCLVFVTQTPDHQLPGMAGLLQNRVGLPTSIAAFDISLGCSGFVYALSVAQGFMDANEFDRALIVTCDPYSKIMSKSDRNTVAIFGDAAAVSLISRQKTKGASEIGRFDFGTDGSGADKLIVDQGGGKNPSGGIWHDDEAPRPSELFMDGRAVFNFMMTRVPETVARTLQRNAIAIDEVDYFVFHQASRFMLQSLAKTLGVDPDKVVVDMEDLGNTVSSTIPIALARLRKRLDLTGKKVLISGFGVGLSWASAILIF